MSAPHRTWLAGPGLLALFLLAATWALPGRAPAQPTPDVPETQGETAPTGDVATHRTPGLPSARTEPAGSPPPLPPDASAPRFEVELAPQQLKIGEPAVLTVTFHHKGNLTLRVPEGINLGQLELLSKEHTFQRDDGGQIEGEQFRFQLAGYETGEVEIPPLPFDYVDPAGRIHRLEVPGGQVRIRSMLENVQAQELKPAPGPLPVEVEDRTLLYVGGIVLALLIGGLIGLLVYRYWRSRPRPEVILPPRPAEEVARERLDALEASDLLTTGQVKEFYLELSGILREYLENRFGIDATAMTSSELIDSLFDRKGKPRPTLQEGGERIGEDRQRAWPLLRHIRRAELQTFFDEADMVQFARYLPQPEDTGAALSQTRSLVERTTPVAPDGQGLTLVSEANTAATGGKA